MDELLYPDEEAFEAALRAEDEDAEDVGEVRLPASVGVDAPVPARWRWCSWCCCSSSSSRSSSNLG